MNSPLQQALGSDWYLLPSALQAHYCSEPSTDAGHMDIEFPTWMGYLVMPFMRLLGALVHRQGKHVHTHVHKYMQGSKQYWHRFMQFPNGQVLRFNSVWQSPGPGLIDEYVNPWLGLRTQVHVDEGQLHYEGVSFVLRVGRRTVHIPENWLLGHTTIHERAIQDSTFDMDFRLTHPWWGQVFRYAGRFNAGVRSISPHSNTVPQLTK